MADANKERLKGELLDEWSIVRLGVIGDGAIHWVGHSMQPYSRIVFEDQEIVAIYGVFPHGSSYDTPLRDFYDVEYSTQDEGGIPFLTRIHSWYRIDDEFKQKTWNLRPIGGYFIEGSSLFAMDNRSK